jgi:3-oxoacyl-[acyl-carrier-protein] synthase-3
MKGREVLRLTLAKLPGLFKETLERAGLSIEDIDLVIPHQASLVIPLAMKVLGVPPEKYINRFAELGNMVSASVPYLFSQVLDEGLVKPGDKVLFCGTAAGLTANLVLLQL